MESIKNLRKICQNKGYKEHITLRFYRIFSIYITRVFLILKPRPEFVVVLGFLSGIMGGYSYLSSSFLLGSVFFIVFLILDCVDGEIARYRKLTSDFGAWLDSTSGHLLYPYFFLTLGLGIYFQTKTLHFIILGIMAAIAKLIERSSLHHLPIKNNNQQLLGNQDVFSIKIWLNNIAKFPVLFFVVLICSLIGWEKNFLWFSAIYLTLFSLSKTFLTGWRFYHFKKNK